MKEFYFLLLLSVAVKTTVHLYKLFSKVTSSLALRMQCKCDLPSSCLCWPDKKGKWGQWQDHISKAAALVCTYTQHPRAAILNGGPTWNQM